MRSLFTSSGLPHFDPHFLIPNSEEFFYLKNISRSGLNFILGTASRNAKHDSAIRFCLRRSVDE